MTKAILRIGGEWRGAARKIPRLAGESASLRDDASVATVQSRFLASQKALARNDKAKKQIPPVSLRSRVGMTKAIRRIRGERRGAARKIPRLAGENASLRDDASVATVQSRFLSSQKALARRNDKGKSRFLLSRWRSRVGMTSQIILRSRVGMTLTKESPRIAWAFSFLRKLVTATVTERRG